MPDELQTLVQWIFAPLLAIIGWVMKRIHSRMDILERDHQAHKLYVSEHHPTKSDLIDFKGDMGKRFDTIDRTLQRIDDKLDGKADK